MSCIDLDLVKVLGLHGTERRLGLRQERLGLDETKAHRDTGRVDDGVGARLDDRRGEGSSGRLEHEMEVVVRIERKPRQLRARVVQWVGDRRQTLAVAPDRKTEQVGLC